MKWLILILAVAANASASILLKVAVSSVRKQSILLDPLSYVSSVWLWLGLFLYGCAFVFYTASLSQFPLNVAHPVITAGAIVTVVGASTLIFGEPFDLITLFGMGLVVSGLVVLGFRMGQ
jgi:multidrug transporter EmrE-like cation transporter